MKLFDLFKKQPIQNTENKEERSIFGDALSFSVYGTCTPSKALLLSTVYRCVDVISDSVAQLPIEPFIVDKDGYKTKAINHSTYWLLNREPNKLMTRFSFIKAIVVSILLKGNAYAYIERDREGNAINLYYLNPDTVKITTDKNKLQYIVQGKVIEACNMLHFLNFTYDGIKGISTLENARNTLNLAQSAELHATGFFNGGANLSGILKVNSSLTSDQKQKLKSSWNQAFNASTGTPNGIAILEGNMDYQPVTVNPADAQLLETREFNVVDICRFFGVSPVKAFDLTKSSYSTVEATQLAFLTDTLSPLLEKLELEFERKLYLPSERNSIDVRFDTSVLIRADKAAMASFYNTLFNVGAISPNEIRRELDLPKIEKGDNTFIQLNLQTLKNTDETKE